MKEKLLIVTHHLTVGGVQKTLIPALTAIDYDKYDVTLYLRKNRTDLLSLIDKRVKVIINNDGHHYYRRLDCLWLQFLLLMCRFIKNDSKAKHFQNKLNDRVRWYGMEYERKTYFANMFYDKAIAYVHGYAAQFVSECVNANRKYMFFHCSTDELREVHKKIIIDFDKIVALHDVQKELIQGWYPEIADKIVVVENYVDRGMVCLQAEEDKIEKPQGKTLLCTCGRMTPVKGFDLAVKSAKQLKTKGLPFLWYFVGDGPQRKEFEALIAQYNLEEEIVFAGMQKNPYPYMKACDVYVQPSYEESLGLTMVEAMSLEKPVVSTKTVGGKLLIRPGVNGLLCDFQPQSLADAIEHLISDKQLHQGICIYLKQADYTEEFKKYKKQWRQLLEG
jgi:glycosyltransferase involved in cell wall biosynthesis